MPALARAGAWLGHRAQRPLDPSAAPPRCLPATLAEGPLNVGSSSAAREQARCTRHAARWHWADVHSLRKRQAGPRAASHPRGAVLATTPVSAQSRPALQNLRFQPRGQGEGSTERDSPARAASLGPTTSWTQADPSGGGPRAPPRPPQGHTRSLTTFVSYWLSIQLCP